MVVTRRSRGMAAAFPAASDVGDGGGDGGSRTLLNWFMKSSSLLFQRGGTSGCTRAERKREPFSPRVTAPPDRPPLWRGYAPAKATPPVGRVAFFFLSLSQRKEGPHPCPQRRTRRRRPGRALRFFFQYLGACRRRTPRIRAVLNVPKESVSPRPFFPMLPPDPDPALGRSPIGAPPKGC